MNYKKTALFAGIGLLLIIAANYFLTLTIYNPRFAVKAYSWLYRVGIGDKLFEDEDGDFNKLYPTVSIFDLQHNLFWKSHARAIGAVSEIVRAGDGDWHVNVTDDKGRTLVTEFAPEVPLAVPSVGDKISIWGITRFDLEHRWWEIHPVFGWKKVRQ